MNYAGFGAVIAALTLIMFGLTSVNAYAIEPVFYRQPGM